MNGAAASGGGGAETKFVIEVETTIGDLDFRIDSGLSAAAAAAAGINFNVDWGDGDSDSGVTYDITHTYPGPGFYDIKIDGRLAMQGAAMGTTSTYKIKKLKNWGTDECSMASIYRMFYKAKFMTYEATDYPDVSNLYTAGVSRTFGELFRECEAITELDLTGWAGNLGNANGFSSMFMKCKNLESVNVTGWDFSTTNSITSTFREVGSLTTNGCKVIAPNLDISNASLFDYMFYFSKLHADTNVTGWTLRPSGQRWLATLYATTGDWAENIDLSTWTNMKPTSLQSTFQGLNSSDSTKVTINVTGMDTSSCTTWQYFLKDNNALTSLIGASGFTSTSSTTGIRECFIKCKVLNISPSAPAANQFPAAFWSGFGSQTIWQNAFDSFGLTTSYAPPTGFDNLDTSGATNAQGMFGSSGFTSSPDLSGLDFSGIVAVGSAPQVRTFYGMFFQNDGITSVDASGWNFSSGGVESLQFFARSSEITSINFGSGTSTNDFSSVASISEMVRYAPITSLEWPTNADFSSLTNATNFCQSSAVPMTTAQYDNFLTRIYATNSNTGLTYSMGSCTYTLGEVDNGTTDGAVAFKLTDSTQNFGTTVNVGDIVVGLDASGDEDSEAKVTNVDSDTTLTLDVDGSLSTSGKGYKIGASSVVKDKYEILLSGNSIVDGNGVN